MPFTYHQLDNNKKCKLCGRQFKSTAKADNCPGVPIRKCRKNEIAKINAYELNCEIKTNAEPVAFLSEKHTKSRNEDYFIYRKKDTEIVDKNLPPAYLKREDIPDPTAITIAEMRRQNLELKEGTKSIAVIRIKRYWKHYYSLKDTQPGDALQYITKTRLRNEYHLSKKWIERLGTPDLTTKNPHYNDASPMQLYLVGRVKKFLKDNAEEYAKWLTKRDKLVLNAGHLVEANRKKAEAKAKIEEQNKQCVKCRSSAITNDERGFFCVIHPMGWLADVPLQRFCPDYSD